MDDLIRLSRKAAKEWEGTDAYHQAEILINTLCDRIETFYAADAVPVVRCRECKHARKSEDTFDWDGTTPLCKCSYMTQPNRWYEYCSYGERRNDDAAD